MAPAMPSTMHTLRIGAPLVLDEVCVLVVHIQIPRHRPTSQPPPTQKNIHTNHTPKTQTPAHSPTHMQHIKKQPQNVTLSLVEIRDSRCPVGALCALAGKATAVIEIGPGTCTCMTVCIYRCGCVVRVYVNMTVYIYMWLCGMCLCEYNVLTHPYPSMHIYPPTHISSHVHIYSQHKHPPTFYSTYTHIYTNTCHSATRARGAGRVGPGGDSGRVSPDVREHRAQAHPGAREPRVGKCFLLCVYVGMDGSRVGGGGC